MSLSNLDPAVTRALAEAINVASWLALIFGFAAWPFVLVWAYLRPVARPLDATELGATQQKPGEGWFTLPRLYGPLEPILDKTWRWNDIERVPIP